MSGEARRVAVGLERPMIDGAVPMVVGGRALPRRRRGGCRGSWKGWHVRAALAENGDGDGE